MLLQSAPRIIDIQVQCIIPSPPKEKRRVTPAYPATPLRDENYEPVVGKENAAGVKATKFGDTFADSPSTSEATEDSSSPN